MLRNLSKYYLLICCKQGSSTHFCHFLATAFVTDVLVGSNPSVMGPKKKGLHSWEPIKSVVGDEGCRVRLAPPAPRFVATLLACSAGKRFAFPQLRTLAGSNPMKWAQTKNGPLSRTVSKSVVGDEGCRVRLTPPAFASGLRPSRAALENVSRFLSFAPCRVRIPCAGPKQKRSPCEDRFQFNGGR